MMKTDYCGKIKSGSLSDKNVPTPKRDQKIHPEVIHTLVDVYKRLNDKSFKDFGFKSYNDKFIRSVVKSFVKRARKGIIAA